MNPTLKYLIILLTLCIIGCHNHSQELLLYKEKDSVKLHLEVFYPPTPQIDKPYPAIIFFFGGGWIGGDRSHFKHHADYFSERGLVCFLADYRTQKKHGVKPFECLKDAKSAIRYIRENASTLKINPDRIIASGGSAGGHLAAATALIESYDDELDNHSMSCKPNALVLYNPVIDNGPGGYGYDRIGDAYTDFSPLHNIDVNAPPTIFFLGNQDKLIPVATAENYKELMEQSGVRCDLHIYEGKAHGFFNHRNFEDYTSTIIQTDEFLVSLGYLDELPKIEIK